MKTNDSLEFMRYFDAAPASGITETMRVRSVARLEQLHQLPSNVPKMPRVKQARQISRRQLAFRLTAIPVAAAATVAGSMLIPVNRPGAPQSAFANWSPVASAISAPLTDPVTAACLAQLNELGTETRSIPGGGARPAALTTQLTGAPTVSEQRGDWILLGFSAEGVASDDSVGDGGAYGECLVRLVDGKPIVGTASLLAGRWVLNRNVRPYSDMTWATTAPMAPDGISQFRIAEFVIPDDGALLSFSGTVGESVTGATLHLTDGRDVETTVANEHLVAWWPLQEGEKGMTVGRYPGQYSSIHTSDFLEGITFKLNGGVSREVGIEDLFPRGFGVFGVQTAQSELITENPYCVLLPATGGPVGIWECPMPGDPNWENSQRWISENS